MTVKRYAGDGGQVDKILASIGDNAYTRAWSDATAGAVRPLDRAIASDSDKLAGSLRAIQGVIDEGVAAAGGKGLSAEAGQELLQHLNALDPSGGLASRAQAGIQQAFERAKSGSTTVGREFAAAVFDARKDLQVADLDKYVAQHPPSDAHMLTNAGTYAHALLGSAPAAYGVPAAGVGLAALALNDYLASQQQGEKESRLPLS